MSLTEEKVREIIDRIVSHPISIFSLKVNSGPNHSLVEIALDNLSHPTGSISIGECEKVSRQVSAEIENIEKDLNFTLQVASAGAERDLSLPADLARFSGQLARLFYTGVDGKVRDGVFRLSDISDDRIRLLIFDKKKKKREQEIILDVKDIKKGNLYLDF
ncbi:MAG: ribosome maturation factor RimP [Leptospira sp.]|nr:ribosome maturation factor RimP [Leptospira sp.]